MKIYKHLALAKKEIKEKKLYGFDLINIFYDTFDTIITSYIQDNKVINIADCQKKQDRLENILINRLNLYQ